MKLILVPVIAFMAFIATPAKGDQPADGIGASVHVSAAITVAPTIIIAIPTAALSHVTNAAFPGPFKQAVIRAAAVDAAEYLAGGERGAVLSALIEANPSRSEDEMIDLVIEAAEQY